MTAYDWSQGTAEWLTNLKINEENQILDKKAHGNKCFVSSLK